jgi:hypothetical protein
MSAADIARELGNARSEGKDWRCDCPVCHHHNLTLSDGDTQVLVRCFNGCTAEQVLAELGNRGHGSTNGKAGGEPHVDTQAEHEAKAKSAKAKRQARIDNALDIWRNSVPAGDTMAATYLASRLLLPKPMPAALRLAPSIYHKESGARHPALIGLVEHMTHGPVGIHGVFLNRLDASVRFSTEPRKMSFGPVKGGAVRLAPTGPVIAVAEGIEDALTFQEVTGTPSWAAITAAGIKGFTPPPRAETPTIILVEDQDQNQTGQQAVANAAKRLSKAGYEIRIARPIVGKDLNEALLKLGFGETLFSIEDYQPDEVHDAAALALISDDTLALRFTETYASQLRYVASWGDWMWWADTHWKHEETLRAFDLARDVCRAISAQINDPKAVKLAAAVASAKTVAAVERLAKADRGHAMTIDQWDADAWLFNPPGQE